MGVADQMRAKLEAAFAPAALDVIDESHQHAGHAGAREGGESHFRVVMSAASLADMNRVARSRAVHKVLEEELAGPVHALALELSVP
ncbi:MAG: BolA family protein [Pseudomonadota bacterium]